MIAKHSDKLNLAILRTHNFHKPLSEDFLSVFGSAMTSMGPEKSGVYLSDISRLISSIDTILLGPNVPPASIVEYHQIKRNLCLCQHRIPVYKKIF